MRFLIRFLLWSVSIIPVAAAEPTARLERAPVDGAATGMMWIAFPDPRLELRGLPWFEENAPELWRLPQEAKSRIPAGVWNRAIAPDGGRIRFASATARLALRVEIKPGQRKPSFFDAYIDDVFAGSASATGPRTVELVLFDGRKGERKNITIYLPNTSEVRVLAVGVDAGADLQTARAFALQKPIVCYGSSVLQGTGADHPAKTYPAVLARRLNLDFVNLGFGGAGKAEPAVVDLVNRLDASCYLFDLGKSYGTQTKEAFVRMLAAVRAAHPRVPILCVTPIYSTKEINEKEYREKSVNLRTMMREAALEQRKAGDENIFVVEGLELFGPGDKALFHDPQHPNDQGNELMGERLITLVERVVLGRH
jgi:lysophospholipase L1-like esterase